MKVYVVSRPVTASELEKMHEMAAALLLHDTAYLPIFERVEQEIAARQTQDDAISRARAIAARYKATG